jgi:hypothetical protein
VILLSSEGSGQAFARFSEELQVALQRFCENDTNNGLA